MWALVPVVARHQRGSPSDLSVSLAGLVQFAVGPAGRPGGGRIRMHHALADIIGARTLMRETCR